MMPLGQILPGSLFGDTLTDLASKSKTIVEIGTWRGQGSTLCLANGLNDPSQRMWTVECDKILWLQAKGYFNFEHRIRFLCARALDIQDELPAVIDLLLVDGSDEGAFAELLAFSSRCKMIALDDTNEIKNKQGRQYLIDQKWKMIHDHPEDRLGWSVFEK